MQISWVYWCYAGANSALLFTCAVSVPLFLYWSYESKNTRGSPLPIWYILPWTVAAHIVIAGLPMSWIWPRIGDPAFSVNIIQAVTESQSFWSYLIRTALLLVVVWGKILIIWRARRWRVSVLLAVAAWIVAASAIATIGHRNEINSYCEALPKQCAEQHEAGKTGIAG